MYSVNDLFKEQITRVDATLLPQGFQGNITKARQTQDNIGKIIDYLGKLSATAQGLPKVITSAKNMAQQKYFIYIITDPSAYAGTGRAIGYLKVGQKHLFLLDRSNVVHEVDPCCVLDFFIDTDYQRKGFGEMVFQYMLKDLQLNVNQIAVDGPSESIIQFLNKKYDVKELITQNNNFAVSPEFFLTGGSQTFKLPLAVTPNIQPKSAIGESTGYDASAGVCNVSNDRLQL